MSGSGHSRRFGDVRTTSDLPRKPTFIVRFGMSVSCEIRTWSLFAHLVGVAEQQERDKQAEDFGNHQAKDRPKAVLRGYARGNSRANASFPAARRVGIVTNGLLFRVLDGSPGTRRSHRSIGRFKTGSPSRCGINLLRSFRRERGTQKRNQQSRTKKPLRIHHDDFSCSMSKQASTLIL